MKRGIFGVLSSRDQSAVVPIQSPPTGTATDSCPIELPSASNGRPGRAKGSLRVPGSGRKRGTPNKVVGDLRELVLTKGKPIEFLCAVVQGKRVRVGPIACPGAPEWVYPSFADRLKAAAILAAKIMPDQAQTEFSAEVTVERRTPDDLELARRIAFLLTRADRTKKP